MKKFININLLIVSLFLWGCAGTADKDDAVDDVTAQQDEASIESSQENVAADDEGIDETVVDETEKLDENGNPVFVIPPDPYFSQTYPELSDEFTSLYNDAINDVTAEKLEEAKNKFIELITMNADVSSPYFQLALIYKNQDDAKLAKSFAEKAIEKNRYNYDAHNLLAVIYRENGEFAKAEQQYQMILSMWQGYAAAHLNLGILYDLYLHEMPKAKAAYEMYLKIVAEDKKVQAWVADLSRRIDNASQ